MGIKPLNLQYINLPEVFYPRYMPIDELHNDNDRHRSGPSPAQRARLFYRDILNAFSAKYPRLMDENIGMFKVVHAFEDKIPLIETLLEQNLLVGGIIKKSSSETQSQTAQYLQSRLLENDLFMMRSNTVYAHDIPNLSERVKGRPLIIGDHGGYFSHVLPSLCRAFGKQLIGLTEHTLNGEERTLYQHANRNMPLSYFSTARLDLKERSDREIAYNIALEITRTAEELGKPIFSNQNHVTILLIGYGTMGIHAAHMLKNIGCQAELLVTDISQKKLVFAIQDGHEITKDIESVLPSADIVILATNTIRGKSPVLLPHHFRLLKKDACLTSMTSFDDEAAHEDLVKNKIIRLIGFEGDNGVYVGPEQNTFFLMQNGRPANVGLKDGGAAESIYLVEAAGLAGAFVVAQKGILKETGTNTLSDEDAEIIASLWMKHFYQPA